MSCMMIDVGPKFYFVPLSPMFVTYLSRSQTLTFRVNFGVKVLWFILGLMKCFA